MECDNYASGSISLLSCEQGMFAGVDIELDCVEDAGSLTGRGSKMKTGQLEMIM